MNVTLRQAAQRVSNSTSGSDEGLRDQGRKVKMLVVWEGMSSG